MPDELPAVIHAWIDDITTLRRDLASVTHADDYLGFVERFFECVISATVRFRQLRPLSTEEFACVEDPLIALLNEMNGWIETVAGLGISLTNTSGVLAIGNVSVRYDPQIGALITRN